MTTDDKSKGPVYTDFINDERLEDAFKEPVTNEDGECIQIPAIWNEYVYSKDDDGVLIIDKKSANIKSNLYSKYLDEKALVWDSINKRLLLYLPDQKNPQMAFKGSNWQFAKRLKSEYEEFITLRDVYYELIEKLS